METTTVSATLASPGRRLAGFLLDVFLFGFTLAIGWLAWYLVVAGRGQSPGKQILHLYVLREDGGVAGFGWMLLRDLLVRGFAFATLDLILLSAIGAQGIWIVLLAFAAAALWCLGDGERQCLWDKLVRTRVAFVPGGLGAAAERERAEPQAPRA